ncbi:MAG: hypothetical protein KJ882_01790 [Proteobacteria bacterium]|nr:hypothetical protein [Pseudomonadota bacterium]MBU4009471.1 hypothetical protein [Pseudomonadota bacterium]MBU4037413.1 hypothetical protein [Pseudomonadota bacterium]
MTSEGDIILIYFEGKPLAFARIEEILPNSKPSWYHVKLLMLQVPVHTITWILRDSYINGAEFTMNGKKIRIEQVICPDDQTDQTGQNDQKAPQTQNNEAEGAKVIPFADIKKK